MENLKEAYSQIENYSGFTYHLTNGDMRGTANWAVSTMGNEVRVPFGMPETFNTALKLFIMKHSEALSEDHFCVGAWLQDDEVVLDLTELFPTDEYTQEGIREIGRLREQTAVFNLLTDDEVLCFDILHRSGWNYWLCSNAGMEMARSMNYLPDADNGRVWFSLGSAIPDFDLEECMEAGIYAANLK